MAKMDWKKLVSTVAPTIGKALGGPLVGTAVQYVSNALLGKPEATDEEIEAALATASPDTLLKLKEAENSFKIQMKELNISEEKLVYDDRANARAREIAVKDRMPALLAIMLVTMFGVALWALFGVEIPEGNKAVIYSMIGSLGTLTITACAYYHGSSNGSAKKNDLIANVGKKNG